MAFKTYQPKFTELAGKNRYMVAPSGKKFRVWFVEEINSLISLGWAEYKESKNG